MLHSTTNWLTKSSCVVGLTVQIIEQVFEAFSNFKKTDTCPVFDAVLDYRFTDPLIQVPNHVVEMPSCLLVAVKLRYVHSTLTLAIICLLHNLLLP